MQAFLSMGGYGLYVWGAYGSLLVSFALGIWYPWRQRKQLLKALSHDESAA
jgi:heme exporter protein CcmD